MFNSEKCQERILNHGFHLVGFSRPEISTETASHFLSWLENGYDGKMAWIRKRTEERLFPEKYLTGIQSVIVVGKYYQPKNSNAGLNFSSYIRGQDYHDIFKAELKMISLELKQEYGDQYTFRACVDTSPILERAYAQQAGLGWQGKNTLVINQKHGSYFFIGEIMTDLACDQYSEPAANRCGTCTRCLDACPPNAFVSPYVLDSNKCLSYQTIETKGPLEENAKLHDWVYGCDICQEVCPWNKKDSLLKELLFEGEHFTDTITLSEILQLNDESFRALFKKSAVKRIRREGLIRNALVLWQENQQLADKKHVQSLLNDENIAIQSYAQQALS